MKLNIYNTIQLSFDIGSHRPSYRKFRSSRTRLGGVDALVLRAFVCEELAQGLYTVTVSDETRTRTVRVLGSLVEVRVVQDTFHFCNRPKLKLVD